jgi:hypothetical protein
MVTRSRELYKLSAIGSIGKPQQHLFCLLPLLVGGLVQVNPEPAVIFGIRMAAKEHIVIKGGLENQDRTQNVSGDIRIHQAPVESFLPEVFDNFFVVFLENQHDDLSKILSRMSRIK